MELKFESRELQLSPPFPSSLAPIKPANSGSPRKTAVKTERERERLTAYVCVQNIGQWRLLNTDVNAHEADIFNAR